MESLKEKRLNKRDLWSNPGRRRPESNISQAFFCNIGGRSGSPNSIMEGYCHPCWSQWDKTSFGDSLKHYHKQLGVSRFISLQESIPAFSHISSLCFFAPEPHMLIWWQTRPRNVWRKNLWLFCIKKSPFAYVKASNSKKIQLQLFNLYTQRYTIIYVFNKLSLRRCRWSILHRGHMRLLSWWCQDPCGPHHGFHHDLCPN